MTRLELAICEAENNGEIDIYTRDTMLSMINESTAQTRRIAQMEKQIKTLGQKQDSLEKMKKQYLAKGEMDKASSIESKISDIQNKIRSIARDQHKIDPNYAAGTAYGNGKSAARCIADMNKYKDSQPSEIIQRLRANANFWANSGHYHSGNNPLRGNSKRTEPKAGRYKTTNGLKESVLEEIYEAELNGDIDIHTRYSLSDMVNESTAQTRHSKTYAEVNKLLKEWCILRKKANKIHEQIAELYRVSSELYDKSIKARTDGDTTEEGRLDKEISRIDDRLYSLHTEINNIYDRLNTLESHGKQLVFELETQVKENPNKINELSYAAGSLHSRSNILNDDKLVDSVKRYRNVKASNQSNRPLPAEKPNNYANVKLSDDERKCLQAITDINNALSEIRKTKKIIDTELAKGKRFLAGHMKKNLNKAGTKLKSDRDKIKSGDAYKKLSNSIKAAHDVQTTKESVLEEIYEAELCGDITPEERKTLIDYMDY